jgi:methanogenic corrinoid protein MtbC1
VLLRNAGYRVEFLGPDIPLEDLADYAADENPKMLILSATLVESAQELVKLPQMLKKSRQVPLFGFGGSAFNYHQELIKKVDGIYLGPTLRQSIDAVTSHVILRTTSKK